LISNAIANDDHHDLQLKEKQKVSTTEVPVVQIIKGDIKSLRIANYIEIVPTWPNVGKHILAQFDDDCIVVYQAFNESIARYAVEHKKFGGAYSFTRMSWIKTNFLWMMYRSDWGCSANQEVILAIWVKKPDFETLLANVVHSTYKPQYGSQNDWKKAVSNSDIRLQWYL